MAMAMAKLAILILAAAILAGTSNGRQGYLYELEVKTANDALSGTEALVAFEFYESSGGAGVIRLVDGDGALFKKGSTDRLMFNEPLSFKTCRLGLRLLDTGLLDKEWECEYVRLRIEGEPSGQFPGEVIRKFRVNQWVRPGKRVQIDMC
ncbi:hypothetical protein CFC21_085714 [Triticum aestivum]|uniref:PLAT domain-containing protein n=2 Tax=Triticum aestivum TaxID=4565 RepID=A0A9R1L8Q4_WHEAT|nr:hypothetical protein CFC21_085714 [Triticum aestivum]